MRGDARSMRVFRPADPAEAVELYAREPDAVALAGGTDFMVGFNAGRANGRKVLDLSRLRDWAGIKVRKDGLLIGALVTHSMVERHPVVLRRLPLLAQACASVGARQIRNRGTLGGNIANASPAGDSFPALAVYEAVVHMVSKEGRRSMPVLDLFTGVKKTALKPGELIESVEIIFPRRAPDRVLFRKVGSRRAQTISKTVGAGLLWLKGGKVSELRFSFGSVAPTVRRLKKIEAALLGKVLSRECVEGACALLGEDISPIDDLRSTRRYRLEVSRNILRGFLTR